MTSHWTQTTASGLRPLQNMSKKQREATPPRFAQYLVDQVRIRTGKFWVAALWIAEDSVYFDIPGVDCWPRSRDARSYNGVLPTISHPPCGPWGKLAWRSLEATRSDGLLALRIAKRCGGVIEQPSSSSLLAGGDVVNQSDWGHQALKPTRLVWFERPR